MVNVKLIKIDNWLCSNKLSLNYSKSTFMLTKSLKNNSNLSETCSFQIKINDSCFQRATCAKCFEVLIDSSLDSSSHVLYIKSKPVRASYLFHEIWNVVSVDVLKMLYFSLVHCHLKYCIASWGADTNSVLQPLEVVHNTILRTITHNKHRCHITPVHKSLNILKLHDIYKLELAKLMHKFTMECCQHHLNICFRKRLKFIVMIQDMQPTKTISYNKFQQTLAKKQFLIEELHIGQM